MEGSLVPLWPAPHLDLVIAEPGGAFRQAQAYLGWLKSQLGPFQFSIPLDQVTLDNYAQVQQWATRYAAQLPAVPVAQDDTRVGIALKDDGNANEVRIESIDPINVPEGNSDRAPDDLDAA